MTHMSNDFIRFTGYFSTVCPLTIYYWAALVLIAIPISFSKKWPIDLKKVLIDAFLYLGIALFIIYILFAIFAHTDCLHFANALGGLTENERAGYFARFRHYFVWKTTWIVLLMSIAFFERFSLLQYIQNKIKTT